MLSTATRPIEAAVPDCAQTQTQETPKTRVLVADDDESTLTLVAHILEKAGYEVCLASDGRQAVRVLRNQSADVLITDIVMPEQDGIETILQVRRSHPNLKVIAMSGVDEHEHYLQTASYLGARAILPKPLKKATLLETLRKVLE